MEVVEEEVQVLHQAMRSMQDNAIWHQQQVTACHASRPSAAQVTHGAPIAVLLQ